MAGTGTKPPLESKGVNVEAVIAGTATNCKVAVEISNYSTKTLHAPVSYMESGSVEYSIPSTVGPKEKRACGFRKRRVGLFGCSGILIYRIQASDKCLCLFFSNPHSPVYKREFAISIENWLPQNTSARLYEQMISRTDKNEGTSYTKSLALASDISVACSSTLLTVKAKMLDDNQSIIWLDVMDLNAEAVRLQAQVNANTALSRNYPENPHNAYYA